MKNRILNNVGYRPARRKRRHTSVVRPIEPRNFAEAEDGRSTVFPLERGERRDRGGDGEPAETLGIKTNTTRMEHNRLEHPFSKSETETTNDWRG